MKTTGIQAEPRDEDMSDEIDFSQGTRGKFYQPGLRINLPASRSLMFADSEVSAVTLTNEGIRIRMSAAHVLQSEGESTTKPAEGFSRGVEILLSGTPALDRPPNSFMGRISNGRARLGPQWASTLSLPCAITASVKLELTFANQSHLEITASGLECRFDGEPNFSESLSC